MCKREIKFRWFAVPFVLVAVMIVAFTLLASQSNSLTRPVIAENVSANPSQVMAGSLPTTSAVIANSLVEDIVCLKGDKGGCPTAGSGYGDIFQIDLMSGKYKYTDCPSSPVGTGPSGFRLPLIPGNRMVTGEVTISDPIVGGGCSRYNFVRPSSVLGGKPVVEGYIVRCSNTAGIVTVTGQIEIRYAAILPFGGKASVRNILCDTILTPASCSC